MGYKNKTIEEYMKEYRKISKGKPNVWFTKTFGRMKRDNKNKFNLELPFTKEEFKMWIYNTYKERFELLLQEYINSNLNKMKNPSIDRIDDYKPYTFDNMQLLTWEENNNKGRESDKNKNQCSEMAKNYWSKQVIQTTLDGDVVKIYSSVREAERELGIDASSISKCCRGILKSTKGYRWKYINT